MCYSGTSFLSARLVALVLCFLFFLYPVSVDGLSVNYSFMLLPLFYAIFEGKVRKVESLYVFFIALYTFIFIVASLYQFEFIEDGLRRIISFILFLSMFCYMLIKIDKGLVDAFKLSLVLMSLFFSFESIYTFFMLGGSQLHFEAKELVGGQRYGFVYLIALWTAQYYVPPNRNFAVLKYAAIAVIIAGILMTFSRSSIVALFISMGVFVIWRGRRWLIRPTSSGLKKGVTAIILVCALIWLLNYLFPIAFEFYWERLFAFYSNADNAIAVASDSETSEGTRVFIWTKVFEFVASNPLTGSGYLGVWSLQLFGDPSGSAHNQYVDVFFRTGFLGFAIYLFLLCRVAKHLYREDQGLFWGLISVLVYGVFHETFKESHGGFILAFLVGVLGQVSGRNRERLIIGKGSVCAS